ncbi:MAG: hypothetical protein BMS9Abin08_0197 [Gammaproteobacteria bacterium]|nr:MAG: hypothetical protein BMS9Abin08_0197 [Gammaproteobacteria bacterium]
MNYAAEKHFVPSHDSLLSNAGEGGLPWEVENGSSAARHDTWLLSFIDILALLLTLFVLLLAYQDRDMESADAVAHPAGEFSPDFDTALGLLFRQPVLIPADLSVSEGYAMPGEGLLPVDTGTAHPETEIEAPAAPVTQAPEEPPGVPESSEAARDDGLIQGEEESLDVPAQVMSGTNATPHAPENPVEALLEVFEGSELRDRVEVAVHPGEVNLEISDSILFARGSAALTHEGRALLKDLAEVLGGQPYTLSVEGHTDNIPIETTRYPSNWELSSARAAVVTRKLIEQGIAPDRVRAIGYGETRPLADNRTPEGRSRNRRVSFILQLR